MISFTKKLLIYISIGLLFLFFSNQLFAYDEIEKLENQIKTEQNPQKRLNLYFELFDKLINVGDADVLLKVEQAYNLADSLKNPHYKAKALFYKGITWRIWSNVSKSIEFLFRAKSMFEELNDLDDLAETYRSIAESYRAFEYYDLAVQHAFKAEDIFQKLKDTTGLAKTYNRLAAIYHEKFYNFPEIDNSWYEKKDANEIFKTIAEKPNLKSIYDSLVRYINLAYHYSKLSSNDNVYISTAIIDAAFQNIIGYNKKAREILYNALNIAQHNPNYIDLPLLYHTIGNFYFREKNYKKALEYHNIAYDLSTKFKIPIYKILSSSVLNKIYIELKDYKNASKYLIIYYDTRFEYLKNKSDAQIKVTEYESNLRNKELQIQANKKQTMIIVIAFIIIIALIILSLIAIVRRNLKITRLNELLTQNNLKITDKNIELEKVNKGKDKFFSIIAHDLKNPVSSFRMSTNMINESFDNFSVDELKEIFSMMKESSDSLYDLLENLLEWSRSQRGTIKFIASETNICNLVELAISPLKNTARQKEIELINNVPENYFLVVDQNLINTVIRNLVSNAIKFTPSGGKVTIGIKEENEDSATFFVADTGVGISAENMGKLFKIDEQVSTLGTNNEKGTGLGLILCAEFVAKHFGKIWVESKLGAGTTIFIKLSKKIQPYEETIIE